MAMTGLKILKLLPQTNCKECGSNTCLAFAVKLAAKKVDLSECPYASDEAKEVLGAAAEAPVRKVALGGEKDLTLGEETVLYRHEKTFVSPTALAVAVRDTDDPDAIDATLRDVADYEMERVGETHGVDMLAVVHAGDDADAFVELARKAWETAGKPLVLRSRDAEALTRAAEAVQGSHSLLAGATPETADALREVADKHGHALAVTADDLDGLVAVTARLKEAGFDDIVLDFRTHSLAERFQTNTIARRMAISQSYKPLGYPSLHVASGTELDALVDAVTEISKYGGICVLPEFDPALMASLLTLRLNIFTDPQKPTQVEPKLYPLGEPGADSPVFLTTNFSLTYFLVGGEIENAGLSAWLLVPECEGMSVLTAWAAGKLSGATVGKFAKEIGLEEQVSTRELIIPGYVSQISGDIEEAMPGWSATVGPQEAADLESFIEARVG